MASRDRAVVPWGEAARVARRAVEGVETAVTSLSDPRARLLRRRRVTGAATVGVGGVAGMSGLGTASLAAVGASEWLVVPGAGVTVVLAVPAVALWTRLRRLRRTPLPPPRARRVPLPGLGSPAREPLRRLGSAEASVDELLGVLGRDPTVPPGEITEAREAAGLAADRLRAEAGDLAALVRARDSSSAAAHELAGVVSSALARLDAGVAAYEALVASAARAVAARSAPTGPDPDLLSATDRVDALTDALHQLAAIHPAPRP